MNGIEIAQHDSSVAEISVELKKRVRHHLKKRNRSWRMDETYIKVNGEWKYLFRG